VTDIAAILREHHWDLSEWDVHKPLNLCTCGESIGNVPEKFTDHVAEKVWEALRADGREEWGLQSPDEGEPPSILRGVHRGARIPGGTVNGVECAAVRRYVITTDWERA
jgi:hypothetical protein